MIDGDFVILLFVTYYLGIYWKIVYRYIYPY